MEVSPAPWPLGDHGPSEDERALWVGSTLPHHEWAASIPGPGRTTMERRLEGHWAPRTKGSRMFSGGAECLTDCTADLAGMISLP